MCYIVARLEVARLSVVGFDVAEVYDEFINPGNQVVGGAVQVQRTEPRIISGLPSRSTSCV